MPVCQCLTSGGKGPQCTREVPEGEQFCWQHQHCKTPVAGAVPAKKIVKKPPAKKIPAPVEKPSKPRIYFELLPRELIEELLLYMPLNEIDNLKDLFNRYLTKSWWISRLSVITHLPREALTDVINDADLDHIIRYVRLVDREKNRLDQRQQHYYQYYPRGQPDFFESLYFLTIPYGYVSILKYIDEHKLSKNPIDVVNRFIYYEIRNNPIATVEYLESRGFDIKANNGLILYYAIVNNNYPLTVYLINRGLVIGNDYLPNALSIADVDLDLVKLLVSKIDTAPVRFISLITAPNRDIKRLVDYGLTLPDPQNRSRKEIITTVLRDSRYSPALYDYLLSFEKLSQGQLTTLAKHVLESGQYDKLSFFKKHGADISNDMLKKAFLNLIESKNIPQQSVRSFIDAELIDLKEALSLINKRITEGTAEVSNRDMQRLQAIYSYVAKQLTRKK